MKTVVVLAFIIGSISAVPYSEILTTDQRDGRLITGTVNTAVKTVSDAIKQAGLDPFHIEKKEVNYALPIAGMFSVAAHVGDFKITGISNIKIIRVFYAPVSGRMNIDLEWPLMDIHIGTFSLHSTLLGKKIDLKASGSVRIPKLRVQTAVRINVGVVSGVSVRSIDVSFSLGAIQSNVNLIVQGKDYSNDVNNFISQTLPAVIEEKAADIKELFEKMLLDAINATLKKPKP